MVVTLGTDITGNWTSGVQSVGGTNALRLAAVTPAQFLNAIKAKADEIVVDRPEKP